MIYKNHHRNYAIPPGRERALEDFLNQTHNGIRHKHQHKHNPNSEDALTWSCFEALKQLPPAKRNAALNEIFQDAYQREDFWFLSDNARPEIHIGKEYVGRSTGESTELDASIELPGALVFFEAKLYSGLSPATSSKRDQIARKLRVGVDAPLNDARELFFIFIDIAPRDKLKTMGNAKAASARKFDEYKNHNGALAGALAGLCDAPPAAAVAANMGWLTWGGLFKSILRGML